MAAIKNKKLDVLELENHQIMNVEFNDRDALDPILKRIKAKNKDRQIIMDFIEYSYKQLDQQLDQQSDRGSDKQ
jgi:hypothetical protein